MVEVIFPSDYWAWNVIYAMARLAADLEAMFRYDTGRCVDVWREWSVLVASRMVQGKSTVSL